MGAVWLRHLELLYRPFVGGIDWFQPISQCWARLDSSFAKKMLCRRWVGEEQAEKLQSRLAGQRPRAVPERDKGVWATLYNRGLNRRATAS